MNRLHPFMCERNMPEVEQEPLKIVLESLLLTSTETLALSDMRQALSAPV